MRSALLLLFSCFCDWIGLSRLHPGSADLFWAYFAWIIRLNKDTLTMNVQLN
jgi:hypothetical protein